MEFVFYMGIAFFIALAHVLWSILNWVWFTPKRLEKSLRQQGFKGNSYKVLFGDMREFAKMTEEAKSSPISLSDDIVPRIVPLFHKAVKAHGKNCFVWLGPRPWLAIMEPELIKEVLSGKFKFEKVATNPFVKLLVQGLSEYDGEKWSKHRKIINPAFHMEKLKHMVPAFYISCCDMLSKWNDEVSKEGSEVDVWPYLETMTSDVISRTAFGSNYEEGRRIFQLQREQSLLVTESTTSLYIPGRRFFPTKKNKRMNEIYNEVRTSLIDIINKRVKAMNAEGVSKDDLLGILLDSNFKEIKKHGNDKNVGMTVDEVIGECKLFYFAGQETTSVWLVWTLILLSKHQDWQQRARDEVLQVLGNHGPNFENLNQLKVVTMILYEVLRLYPPLPALTRIVSEETKLGEMSIPAGTILFLPEVLIHHDRDIWGEDAKEFKPERFSEGLSKANKNLGAFFPFGFGPRVCIGQNFAMAEAKMALAMILQQFAFELSPSYVHAPDSVVTIKPQYGAHLILRKL